MSTWHSGNVQNSIMNEEHEHSVGPATKRVLSYGWDGSSKNIAFVDTNGTMRSIVTIASAINTSLSGNVTLNPSSAHIGSVSVFGNLSASLGGNVTLNPSPNFIGLTTTVIGSSPTLFAVVNTGAAGVQNSMVTLNSGPNQIGSVTISHTVPVSGTFWQATQPVSGTVAATQSGTWNIGTVTAVTAISNALPAGTNNIGDVDVLTIPALTTGANYIGLATVIPAYISSYTSFATVISATGPATIVVPPSGQRITLKDIHVSSLGRSEVGVYWANGTATGSRIPYTSLSTTAGYFEGYGELGLRWPTINDSLIMVLNGAATVSVMVNVRFGI